VKDLTGVQGVTKLSAGAPLFHTTAEIFSSHVNKYKNIHSIKVFIKHNIGHSYGIRITG
jgi:hypothetical protein